jgi:hypothetical protein
MINIGVYNDNTDYISNDKINFIKFKGDIELIKKEKSSEILENYSKTFQHDAIRINDIIKKNIGNKNILLIDGTTSIGGNFLEFIKYFKYNIGIELNKDRYDKLNDNIKKIDNIVIKKTNKSYNKYIYNNNKIITINGSFINIYYKILKKYENMDIVIFLDPPWGGKEYKNYDKINFGLDGIALLDIIKNIRSIKENVYFCLKLPLNYYLDSFWGMNYKKYIFNKFLIIYL